MIKVLSTDNLEWNNYINKLPINKQDVYYTREYYKMVESNKEGKGQLFIYEKDNFIAIYPFLLNKILNDGLDKLYYDIETAYGYGGPVTNNNKHIREFEESFLKYCRENNIVAEFIRFNPLLKNENIFNNNIEILQNRKTIALNLYETIDDIWMQFSSQNRNRIRKSQNNNLTVNFTKDIILFKKLYENTMNRLSASNYYYFNEAYFNDLDKINNVQINVCLENKVIASAIFFEYKNNLHYHLGGSIREYLNLAPNNLLFWEAIKYAKHKSMSIMHLGGGTTNNEDDTLFRFKKGFGKNINNFYIGKRIHNEEIYKRLIYDWEYKNKIKAKLFLQYKF